MAAISVTYTFSNGTTADASQVSQNFTDIVNGLSDASKDISVNAGTFAGNVSISGNTTLGNASADDVTVTGSLASTINIKTTNTYNIGSSTLGLASVYLGANAQTVRILGSASMSATWTFTFPVSAGTSTYVLATNGSGVTSWTSKTTLNITAKTTTYTATIDDDVITCSTGSAWTLTLPAASTATGKVLEIKKTSSDFNALTIDGNASETIDGATTIKINTQYESMIIMCDGSNWHITRRFIPSVWTAYTPTGSWSANTTYTAFYRRVGDSLQINGKLAIAGGAPTTATLTVNIPSGLTIDTAKLAHGTTANRLLFASYAEYFDTSAGTYHNGYGAYSSTTAVGFFAQRADATYNQKGNAVTESIPMVFASGDDINFFVDVPIVGWAG